MSTAKRSVGRPPIDPALRKARDLQLRITQQLADDIATVSAEQGLTVSDWARDALEQAVLRAIRGAV